MLSIDIVITTYNRRYKVIHAIDSAYQMLLRWQAQQVTTQIIVVDDCSTDQTYQNLQQDYHSLIMAKQLILIKHEKNLGATASKNTGFSAAKSDWVIILDSDDTLIMDSSQQIITSLETYQAAPILFFRCIDQHEQPVGKLFSTPQKLDIKRYVIDGSYGEALPIFNKKLIQQPPYIAALRGHEGLGCARIIERYGSAWLINVFARRYICAGADRLSTFSARFWRGKSLMQGHIIYLREFGKYISLKLKVRCVIKIICYGLMGYLWQVYAFVKRLFS